MKKSTFLTPCEQTILNLQYEGYTLPEIAKLLCKSVRTVYNQKCSINKKYRLFNDEIFNYRIPQRVAEHKIFQSKMN